MDFSVFPNFFRQPPKIGCVRFGLDDFVDMPKEIEMQVKSFR